MTLPTSASKANLDSATDDPKLARPDLADLVDKFNDLLTHLNLSTITSGPAAIPLSVANGGTSAATASAARTALGVEDATETAAGRIEIATQTEANNGTDDTRAITPLKLANISPASVTYAAADQVLLLDASDSNKLKRATITQGVTSITAGVGLTGGTITTTGTVSLDVYSGSSATNTDFPVGTTVLVQLTGTTPYDRGASNAIKYATANNKDFVDSAGTGTTLTGTWSARGAFTTVGLQIAGEGYVTVTTVGQLFQRTA